MYIKNLQLKTPQKNMTKQQVAQPKDSRYKYNCVVTRKMQPDRRFACNRVIGSQRTGHLPQTTQPTPQPPQKNDDTV